MNDTAKALILANIESYVDKMIAKGVIKSENRQQAIDGYKALAKLS